MRNWIGYKLKSHNPFLFFFVFKCVRTACSCHLKSIQLYVYMQVFFPFMFFFFLYTSTDICLKGFGINHLGPCLCCLAIRFCSFKKYSTPTCFSKKLNSAHFPYFAVYVWNSFQIIIEKRVIREVYGFFFWIASALLVMTTQVHL